MEPGDAEMEDPAVLRYVRVVAAYEGKGYEVEVGDVLAVVDEKPATGWCVPRAASRVTLHQQQSRVAARHLSLSGYAGMEGSS
eukprot:COSAG02_NODE_16310_length_1094_cov_0.833166_2_plen_83_part_00